jgi:two-component system OmpR family sensor kinase
MSILKKISILFLVSLILMIYITNLTNETVKDKISSLYIQKYIQVSKEFFKYLSDANFEELSKKAKELHFVEKKLDLKDKTLKIIFEDNLSFGSVKIYQKDELLFLYISYLDDELTFFDLTQEKDMQNKRVLNYLFSTDILLLFLIFIFIIVMIKPLKDIAIAMEKFGLGDYSWRLKKFNNNDEISKVATEFNKMALNIENLLKSREQLLRDVSHELRTPISRLKIALDLQEKNKYTKILKAATNQIDMLTNELLNAEKLNSGNIKLNKQTYDIQTILAHTLSKMLIEDESILDIKISDTIMLNVDIDYFSMAMKNLIDNAIKYKKDGIVKIVINKNEIQIINTGDPLKYDLDYYLKAFTQEDLSRNVKGYGIGLNIVKRVLEKHNLILKYKHKKGFNIFKISI